MTFRRAPANLDPSPAEVLSAEELARAARWRDIYRLATYWHLQPSEVKRGIFLKCLIEAGRIGKGDRN